MNEAIKLAIENGWDSSSASERTGSIFLMCFINAKVIQDPLFWQALDKVLNWQATYRRKRGGYHFAWLHNAILYHELVLTDGDTEKFWKDLLTPAITHHTPQIDQ